MAPKIYQGFQKSFEFGPVQIKEPVDLPLTVSFSTNSPGRGLPTQGLDHRRQQETGVSAPNVESHVDLAQGSDASPHAANDHYTHERVVGTNSAVSSNLEELHAARSDMLHVSPIARSASSRVTGNQQALNKNPLRVNTVLNPLPEESDLSSQYEGNAQRPDREHHKPPLSFAAKQRLPHSTSKSSLSSLRPPISSLQHMSSASTISSIASDISEMSVADSINLDAYNQRAEEREKRERLRLMASNSTLAFSDIE